MGCPKCSDEAIDLFIELDSDWRCPQCSKKIKDPKYDGLSFHDLRRSAVRNMIRRGVSQKVAMQISGHETPSIFERYNIIDETDLRLAVEKIDAGAKIEQAKFGQSLGRVVPESSAIALQIPASKILPD